MLPPLVRVLFGGVLLFGLATFESATPGRAGLLFSIDQRFGSIGFSVDHLGLFSSQGRFDRFTCRLDLDPAHPERTRLQISIDAGSLDMPWGQATDMLRAPDFFDVARYPVICTSARRSHNMMGSTTRSAGCWKYAASPGRRCWMRCC